MTKEVQGDIKTTKLKTYYLGKSNINTGIIFGILGLFFIGMGLFFLLIFTEDLFHEWFLLLLPLGFIAVGISIIIPSIEHRREVKKLLETGNPIITLTPKSIIFHSWIIGKSGTYEINDIEYVKQRFGKRLAITSQGGTQAKPDISFLKKQLLSRAKIRKGRTLLIERGMLDPGPMELKQDIADMWGVEIKKHHSPDSWDIFT